MEFLGNKNDSVKNTPHYTHDCISNVPYQPLLMDVSAK